VNTNGANITLNQPLHYRPDIDGIRAIAVLSVVLYHVNPAFLPGGFVGVDVFFVLSGFLITGIVSREIGNSSFSIVRFYERRCRRIFPALIAVTIATSVAAYILFLPGAFKEFGQSLAALGLFSTNLLFYFEHGYFDGPSELKPLLHTWSLSVEEQFYIVFPIILMALAALPRQITITILAILLIGSLYISVTTTYTQAKFAFYMPFTRAWELLAGGILSICAIKVTNKWIANTVGFSGVALLCLSFSQINAEIAFPGWAAIVPVSGTVFLLIAGTASLDDSSASRLLSTRPAVHIGKLSYSLYLIHWPLIVFLQYYLMRELNPFETVIYLICCLLLSQLSYTWIESPFRKNGFLKPRTIFSLTALFLLSIVAIGVTLHTTNGLPGRYNPDIVLLSKWEENPWRKGCLSKSTSDIANGDYCIHGNKENIKIALIGDSHADALVPAIIKQIDLQNTGIAIFTMRGCRPFMFYEHVGAKRVVNIPESSGNVVKFARNFVSGCGQFMTEAYRQIDALDINHVVVHARWTLQYFGDQADKPTICYFDSELPHCSLNNNKSLFKKYYQQTLSNLGEYQVLVVGPVPEHVFEVPDALGRSRIFERELDFDMNYTSRGREVLKAMEDSTRNTDNVAYIDPYGIFCHHNACKIEDSGRSLYNDTSHLSHSGSRYLGFHFNDSFAEFYRSD
jgi:peptidoglycan/LPS O-acetylase OafA/YrhL